MAESLQVELFTLGDWQTNCYVVHDGREGWVVDAGFEPGRMMDFVAGEGIAIRKVILTHAHVDHVAGLAEVVRRVGEGVPVLIHEAERDFPGDAALNLSVYLAGPVVAPEPTGTLVHGDVLELAGHRFEVRHTPGHSPGGICLYCAEAEVALVGDTLFAGSIGRHDFPTSSYPDLVRSIREQLYSLPDQTRVLAGHMGPTTIGRERMTNPFVRAVPGTEAEQGSPGV